MTQAVQDQVESSESGAPRRRNRRGEVTRAAILDAAIACLDRLGYAATSVEEVMRESGLGRGSVLNQFPTRVDLMVAVADQAMRLMIDHSRAALDAIADPRERLLRNADIGWATHNLPAAMALTEILLASRREQALAAALRPVAEAAERDIDRMHVALARHAGIDDVAAFLIHGRLLNSSLRGLTIELMFNPDRAPIQRAIELLKRDHADFCAGLMADARRDGSALR